MEAIVLAGGFGTRLKSVLPNSPKSMAPIDGRPFLDILLASLAHKGFRRVILSLGFMAHVIHSHFGDQCYGMELVYSIELKPLGTGGALRLALTKCLRDHVYVLNGDTLIDLDFDGLERCWQRYALPILVARHVEDTARYGRLIVANNRIHSFGEKGSTGPGLINAGCYVLSPSQLNEYDLDQPFSFELDYLESAVKHTLFLAFQSDGLFIDIGLPEDYQLAQTLLSRLL